MRKILPSCNYNKKRTQNKVVNQQLKYGKITFKPENAKTVENFTLNELLIGCNLYQVFRFHAFKQIKRGDTIVRADIHGYFFTNPLNGIINDVQFGDGQYPQPNDIKNNLERECVRIINDNAVEDKPSTTIHIDKGNLAPPQLVSGIKLHEDVFNWLTTNFTFKKRYSIQSAQGYDSGQREAIFTFKKKDVLEFGSIGVFGVPIFHLSYIHPNSNKPFKRDYLGYSGELVLDEIKCSKTKFLDKNYEGFPKNVCSSCGNLICEEHTKICERCGKALCKECSKSKGLITKHYYCLSCA